MIEGFQFEGVDFHSPSSPWFWGQWILMAIIILFGFRKNRSKNP